MEFIPAQPRHLEEICVIMEQARAQLRRLGLDQWQKGYPSREVWEQDIRDRAAWLAAEGEQVLGAFMFQTAPEEAYDVIDGSWLTRRPYASIHRVCVRDGSKGRGVAGAMFAHGFELARQAGFDSVRIDTHPENRPMRRALEKAGFVLCGTIRLVRGGEKGDLRLAYERVL